MTISTASISLTNMTIMNISSAANGTNVETGVRIGIIICYVSVGIVGLLGNTLTLIVSCNSSKRKTAQMIVFMLGVVDLVGCLALPLRYLIQYNPGILSPFLCSSLPSIVIFCSHISILSLLVTAVERYKAVQNVNSNTNNSVYKLFALCVVISVVVAVLFRYFVKLDIYYTDGTFYCKPFSLMDIHLPTSFKVPELLLIISSVIVIMGLYFKIVLLLRRRIGIQRKNSYLPNSLELTSPKGLHFPKLKQDNCIANNESKRVNSNEVMQICNATQAKSDNSLSNSVNNIQDNQDRFRLNNICGYKSPPETDSDSKISFSVADVYTVSGTCFTPPNPPVVSPPPSTSIPATKPATTGLTLSLEAVAKLQSAENKTDCSKNLPGVGADDNKNDIPRINDITISLETPSIPNSFEMAEEDQQAYLYKSQVFTKTTLMLFIVTVVCVATYGMTSALFLIDVKGSQYFWELVIINHAINPFIYSIVNVELRKEYQALFSRIQ